MLSSAGGPNAPISGGQVTTMRSEGALGIGSGTVIQLRGWDDDCDEELLAA